MRNKFIGKFPSFPKAKKRRALAGVVTTGILLASITIMGTMMLAWSQSKVLDQRIELNDVFNTQMNKLNEDLLIENIWFAFPSGVMTENHLNFTLSNIGTAGFNVTEIQVTNVTGTNNTSFSYYLTNAGIRQSDTLSLNTTYPWQSNDELDILIFTEKGNQYTDQVIAP